MVTSLKRNLAVLQVRMENLCFLASLYIIKDSGRRRLLGGWVRREKTESSWGGVRKKIDGHKGLQSGRWPSSWSCVGLAGLNIPNGALVLSCSGRSKSELWNRHVTCWRTWTVKGRLEQCWSRPAFREVVLLTLNTFVQENLNQNSLDVFFFP